MNEEEFKVTHIINIPREEINCSRCKHYGEQTCVPYGSCCQYEPTFLYSGARLSLPQINKINETVRNLLQENKQLQELISTILNWNIFKNECPMNFGYGENTIEDKSQEVFYQDDDYCENNCNEDYQKCWLKYFKKMQELEKGEDNE